jgi:hypothetical protein
MVNGSRRPHGLLPRFWLAGVLTTAVAQAENPGNWRQLINHSPFGPVGAANPGPAPGTGFEYRGFVVMEGQLLFRIEEPSRNRGHWLSLGAPEDGLAILSHDEAAGTVTLEAGGQVRVLALQGGRIQDTSQPRDMPPVGVDLVPPRYIRNGLRNQSLYQDEVEPQHTDNEWFREFVRQYGPPVYLERKQP